MPSASLRTLPIFRSATQARLLTHLFVIGGDQPLSLTALRERIDAPLSTVQREVEQLERAGLVASERIGNTRLVHANRDSPYFGDLQSLLLKAFGPTTLLTSLLGRIPRVAEAYIYGSWARRYHGEAGPVPRDLDVLVIGDPNPNAVYRAARRAESELNLEVNPIIATHDEWQKPRGLLKRIQVGPLVELELDHQT
ncbi:MAG: ArsR family transcriptional regulator [Actinobacteria bacterium]|nr:MAG: ArsR family transcriptional regulator [Actinomycetota bacterium]